MKMKPLFSLLLVVHALVPCWAAEVEVADVAALAEALSAASNGDRNDLKFLILRQFQRHGGSPNEYSSWGGGIMHQSHTYGDARIIR